MQVGSTTLPVYDDGLFLHRSSMPGKPRQFLKIRKSSTLQAVTVKCLSQIGASWVEGGTRMISTRSILPLSASYCLRVRTRASSKRLLCNRSTIWLRCHQRVYLSQVLSSKTVSRLKNMNNHLKNRLHRQKSEPALFYFRNLSWNISKNRINISI